MQQSEASPETAPKSAETPNKPQPTDLDKVLNILGGDAENDETKDGDELEAKPDEQPETVDDEKRPETIDELAKRLKLEVKDLYDIKLKLGSGPEETREVTIGELKDQMSTKDDFEVTKLKFEEERNTREQELVKTQQTVAEIVSMLPKSAISKELLSTLARRRANVVEHEEKLTRSVIPTWKDETVEARDREAMGKHLEEYAFAPGYIDTIVDHKTLRYIRESMLREQRMKRALEAVETVRKPGHKPSGTPTDEQKKGKTRAATRARSKTTQIDAVTELLQGLG